MGRSLAFPLVGIACCAALAACVGTRQLPALARPWEQRLRDLQHADAWQLDGRAAVAVGTQGWQASLHWRQQGADTVARLAGPFGAGGLELSRTAAGLSLNGAPPGAAVLAQLQDRLGFELPLDYLRYWLLGVPDPDSSFELARNDQDRARQLTQAGWSIDYERYLPGGGDVLPARLVLRRDAVRVRIVVDHWEWQK